MKESLKKIYSKISTRLSSLFRINIESNDSLCDKWNKEDAIKCKNNLMNELKNRHMVSLSSLEWVDREFDRLIVEQSETCGCGHNKVCSCGDNK
jgi:hypothetical protein